MVSSGAGKDTHKEARMCGQSDEDFNAERPYVFVGKSAGGVARTLRPAPRSLNGKLLDATRTRLLGHLAKHPEAHGKVQRKIWPKGHTHDNEWNGASSEQPCQLHDLSF